MLQSISYLQSQHKHNGEQKHHRHANHVRPRFVLRRISTQQIDARHAARHGVHAGAQRSSKGSAHSQQCQQIHPKRQEQAEKVEALRCTKIRQLNVCQRRSTVGCLMEWAKVDVILNTRTQMFQQILYRTTGHCW